MKYRIKKYGNHEQGFKYKPQYRYNFIPLWFGFSVGAWDEVCYSEKDAREFIEHHIKCKQAIKLNETKIITFK